MSKRFLLLGAAAVIAFLLVVGSFSVGMFVGGIFDEQETPTAAAVLQATVEEILATNTPPKPAHQKILKNFSNHSGKAGTSSTSFISTNL